MIYLQIQPSIIVVFIFSSQASTQKKDEKFLVEKFGSYMYRKE